MKDSYPPGRWEPQPPERWPPGRSHDAWNQSGQVPYWDNPAALLPSFASRRPQRPVSIRIAVALMIMSAVLLGLGVPLLLSIVNSGLNGLYAGLSGFIYRAPGAALWLWMAQANKAGKRWARITATVLFGINALVGAWVWLELGHGAAFSALAIVGTTGFYLVVSLVFFLLGVTEIVLLWTRKSSDYYDAMSPFT
jgi:hypothetical protein